MCFPLRQKKKLWWGHCIIEILWPWNEVLNTQKSVILKSIVKILSFIGWNRTRNVWWAWAKAAVQTQFFTFLCENSTFRSSFNMSRVQWQSLSVLPSQLFPPLVPVVRPDKEDSSCRGERGEFTALTLTPLSTFPQPPFKGVPQEPLCQQAAKGRQSVRRTAESLTYPHLIHKYTNIQSSPSLILCIHISITSYSHVCVHTCLAIRSWTLLVELMWTYIPISSNPHFSGSWLWLSTHGTHFTLSGPDMDNLLSTFETWTERRLLFILNQLRERERGLVHCVFLALGSRKTVQVPSLNATVSSRGIVWPVVYTLRRGLK